MASALDVNHTSLSPSIVSARPVVGRQPARGGFLVLVRGSNFGPVPPVVRVSGLPCNVLASSHEYVVCEAPPRVLGARSLVWVEQAGQVSGQVPVVYDGPVVSSVQPSTLTAAVVGDPRPALALRGVNFGVRYQAGLAVHHSVLVGLVPCEGVVWVSDVELGCNLPPVEFLAGPYPAVVNVSGDVSVPVTVTMLCPVGTFGGPGEACERCPMGAMCLGGIADPVSTPGYYPLGRTQFVECAPRHACIGGVSAVAVREMVSVNGSTSGSGSGALGCSRHYTGSRCGDCAPGAYRLRGECKGCPNTAWLLFVSYPLGILAAVLLAMYLSAKRINMSGLSLGVVCMPSCFASEFWEGLLWCGPLGTSGRPCWVGVLEYVVDA